MAVRVLPLAPHVRPKRFKIAALIVSYVRSIEIAMASRHYVRPAHAYDRPIAAAR